MTLSRLSPAQLVRAAEALIESRGPRLSPQFPMDMGFRNGGPGEPRPGERDPPADYIVWRNGGPVPTTVEGLDWMICALELEEKI